MSRPRAVRIDRLVTTRAVRCAYGYRHAVKSTTYTCADPAWQVTHQPKASESWTWQAVHRDTHASAGADTRRALSKLLGHIQGQLLRCRGCQQGLRYYLEEDGTVERLCRCDLDYGFESVPEAWEGVTIARCIHCGMPFVFRKRSFALVTRTHTIVQHQGRRYGGPDHYLNDGTMRPEYWEKHFVFEYPS